MLKASIAMAVPPEPDDRRAPGPLPVEIAAEASETSPYPATSRTEPPPPPRLGEWAHFLAQFVRHPIRTGAVAPSSRFLAARMIDDMRLGEARTVVELGPGTGSFTRAIESALGGEALFLAVELNPTLAQSLSRRFSRTVVIHDSAERLVELLAGLDRTHADAILCGLPWASFHPALQERLMAAISASLVPGGRFATFQYIHASWFPTARRFRKLLERHFSDVRTTRVVWRNIPPAFVFRCTK